MALFASNKPSHEGRLDKSLMEFHSSQPLLATAWSSPTSVLITNNEGEILTVVQEPRDRDSTSKTTLLVTCLAWHPFERILIIGWSNGKLLLWSMPMAGELGINDEEDIGTYGHSSYVVLSLAAKAATFTDMEDLTHEHRDRSVLLCEWSAQGEYLLTSYDSNTVTLWKLDRSALRQHNEVQNIAREHVIRSLWFVEAPDPIIKAAHIPSKLTSALSRGSLNAPLRKSAPRDSQSPENHDHELSDAPLNVSEDDTVFLLLGGSNCIYIITEEQKLSKVTSRIGSIISFLYDPKERTLVAWNNTQTLEVFHIYRDLSVESLFWRKLTPPGYPTAAPSGGLSPSLAWAGTGSVVIGSGDDRVYVLDIKTETIHTIPLPQVGSHVRIVACSPQRKVLVVGTIEGLASVFIHNNRATPQSAQRSSGKVDDVVSSSDEPNGVALMHMAINDISAWEALTTHNLGEPIDHISINPLGDIAVCTGSAHLQVIHETVRHRAWDGAAAATQISTNLVVIESVTGCQCLLNSKTKIRGLSISFPNIALWNGSQIDIYTINETTSDFVHVNFVPTVSPAFALHRDGLLYVKDGRIIFTTLHLQNIGQLTFTASEGVPVVLDIMKDFVVVVSSKNSLRLVRVTPRGLQPLGPSRPFRLIEDDTEANKVTVVSAHVNAQGRRVALMARVGPLQVPDTHIWVFDADTDKMMTFDFAERNEVPDAVYWNTPEPNASTIGELEYLLLACETHQLRCKTTDSDPNAESIIDEDDDDNKNNFVQARSDEDRDPGTESPAPRFIHREGYAEPMPDLENFAEKKESGAGWGNRSLGLMGILSSRAHNLVTLFATDNGLVVHNSAPLKVYQICLVGLTIPDFLLSSVKIDGDPSNPHDYVIEQKRLRDFDGLQSDNDVAVREALMKFSYYSTIGNMDEAYRCMKMIKDPSAWQSLARMCVSTGRLDVAAVCLATINDAVAARALRESQEDYPNDKNVQLASLACSMGLLEECERLLRASKQYGIITDVFLACGKFERAQQHSERYDRIHIRSVIYKYAQFMESLGNVDASIIWYYNAHCAGTDVPRIFFHNNRLHKLRELMNGRDASRNSSRAVSVCSSNHDAVSSGPRSAFASLFPNNKDLLQWWARYSERRCDIQEALWFYGLCEDTYNQVRLLCGLVPPRIDKALELVDRDIEKANAKFQRYRQQQYVGSSEEKATQQSEPDCVGAAFLIGQYYESERKVDKALQYYQYAGAYYSGARLSRAAERDNDVFEFAARSGDERLMLECALYLSEKGLYSKAVELYRKIGAVQCALEGCIRGGLFDTLHEISMELADSNMASEEVFMSMAEHFQSTGDYSKAVEMLVFAKHYDAALQLCQDQNVTLTEAMADSITGQGNNLPVNEKQELLLRIARIAKDQGLWNLACKKYTQAGDRLKAMKMLMRSGDVDKVIFFANHSRNAEIYTLAGNFLQNQNWSANRNIYNNIVLFYTKSRSFNSLLNFYDSCAQFYIDENRNYEDALQVLDECVRTFEKLAPSQSVGEKISGTDTPKLADLQERMKVVQSFVTAQKLFSEIDPKENIERKKVKGDQIIKLCSDIIKRSRPGNSDHELIEASLRVGDVFALLVHFYFEKLGESRNAFKVLESMPKHNIEPHLFLEIDFMEKVCLANSKQLSSLLPHLSSASGFASKNEHNDLNMVGETESNLLNH
ncbi:unnamed protein product [Phytomonas sp. EM1]|nr:unnamed protein product [Phytomonas sp. EM1]|eukprot:CCW62699.1 unnamed protein product [Phytomonas sp. isolate EM1]